MSEEKDDMFEDEEIMAEHSLSLHQEEPETAYIIGLWGKLTEEIFNKLTKEDEAAIKIFCISLDNPFFDWQSTEVEILTVAVLNQIIMPYYRDVFENSHFLKNLPTRFEDEQGTALLYKEELEVVHRGVKWAIRGRIECMIPDDWRNDFKNVSQ